MVDMIDLHCHILPALDDGAADLAISLQMADAFVEDGVSAVACTPHILPGLYHNTGPDIIREIRKLQLELDQRGIPLTLTTGADVHMTPDLVHGLRTGRLLTLANSRYVLIEPPHHVPPPRLEEAFFGLLVAGFVPILTHPERLSWIKSHYDLFCRLVQSGVWMQITAGSLTGAFGKGPKYWAERMLDERVVHILATDAHDANRRRPILGEGRALAARRVGETEAGHLVVTRPLGVINDQAPTELPLPAAVTLKRSEGSDAGALYRDRAGGDQIVRRASRQGGADDRSERGAGFTDRLRRLFG
jgi:protein-tyrosine phosphatase